VVVVVVDNYYSYLFVVDLNELDFSRTVDDKVFLFDEDIF
jgi:hypothetical protein